MERTLISWNLPNWITISLMAAGAYLALALAAQLAMRAGIMRQAA
jgi:hypothetical protein